MKKIILATFLSGCSFAMVEASTYDLLVKGKQCAEEYNQQLTCSYKIGNDFSLAIVGIGLPDTAVTFMKSDFNGDYYGTFGLLHGCVIVKTGVKNKTSDPFDFAFVSHKNGKIYKDWQSCKAGF